VWIALWKIKKKSLQDKKLSDKAKQNLRSEIRDLDRQRQRLRDDLYGSERQLDRLLDEIRHLH
jgi:chromosome segregation ATPase